MTRATHKQFSPNVETRRGTHFKCESLGHGNIKVNFRNMVHELEKTVISKDEKIFVEKCKKGKMPSRNDVSNIKDNVFFINSIIENMTKGIVFLYKNIDATIDEYLATEEDKFVMADPAGIVRRDPDSDERVDSYQGG